MADRIQQRRDTAARWSQYNPILLEGEVGYELDTDQYKLGDGEHAWNDLPYRGDPCLQQTGQSTTTPMSQKAVTDELNKINADTGVDDYPTFSENTAYSAGDVVNYDGKLYQFTADHAVGAWTGSDVKEWSLKDEIDILDKNSGTFLSAYGILGNSGSNVEDVQAMLLSIPIQDRKNFATLKYRDTKALIHVISYRSGGNTTDESWGNLNNWIELLTMPIIDQFIIKGTYTDRDAVKECGIYRSPVNNNAVQAILFVEVFGDIIYQTEIGTLYNADGVLLRNRKYSDGVWSSWETHDLRNINKFIEDINKSIEDINKSIEVLGNNLLNPETFEVGYVGTSDGIVKTSESYPNAQVSGLIPVNGGSIYNIQGRGSGTGIVGYNENMEQVLPLVSKSSYESALNGDITLNSNVKWIRITLTLQGNDFENIMLSKGGGSKDYESYQNTPVNIAVEDLKERLANVEDASSKYSYPCIVVRRVSTNNISVYSRLGISEYYINFGLLYMNDSNINSQYWRLSTSYLSRYENNGFTNIVPVLQYNENEYVFHIKNGADSTGGYHGDEKLVSMKIVVDGIPYDATDITEGNDIIGEECYYIENSNMYGNAVEDEDVVAKHIKKTTFANGCYITENTVKFLKDLTIDSMYGGMACISKHASSKYIADDMVEHSTTGNNSTIEISDAMTSYVQFWNEENQISAECKSYIEFGLELDLNLEIFDREGDTKYYYRNKEENAVNSGLIYKTVCEVNFRKL